MWSFVKCSSLRSLPTGSLNGLVSFCLFKYAHNLKPQSTKTDAPPQIRKTEWQKQINHKSLPVLSTVAVFSWQLSGEQVGWSQCVSDPLSLPWQESGSGQVGDLDVHPHPPRMSWSGKHLLESPPQHSYGMNPIHSEQLSVIILGYKYVFSVISGCIRWGLHFLCTNGLCFPV